jgi:uncharacterized membrane protein YphA (DoxX/SURF4 family)
VNTLLWILAAVLSAFFLLSGTKKLAQSKDALIESGYAWATDFNPPALKTIGTLEVLAAAGLILPAAVDIAPILVPLAATGLAVLMLGATILHLRRKETAVLALTLPLTALPLALALARFGPESFS